MIIPSGDLTFLVLFGFAGLVNAGIFCLGIQWST